MNGKAKTILMSINNTVANANGILDRDNYRELLEELSIDIEAKLDALREEDDKRDAYQR